MRRPLFVLALLAAVLAALVAVTLPGGSAGAAVSRGALPAGKTAPVAATAPTKLVHVRPVTASGKPAPGWTVRRESGSVSCSGTAPSAVGPGITSCYPSAYGLAACWKSARHTVLCVRDARVRELTRFRYTGAYPTVDAPKTPQPINMELADGRQCQIRTGGAWGQPDQHPRWVGYYSCTRSSDVYAPGAGRGIDTRDARWTAQLWRHGPDPDGRNLVTRAITKAYVVGTAA